MALQRVNQELEDKLYRMVRPQHTLPLTQWPLEACSHEGRVQGSQACANSTDDSHKGLAHPQVE